MTQEARIASATKTDTESAFEEILDLIDGTVEELHELRGPPDEIRRGQAAVHRFRKTDSKTDSLTAILLKLALLSSNLRAGRLLINRGFFYEWTMVRRLICETIEDVMLLLGEVFSDPGGELHKRYLDAFYSEEVDYQGRLNIEHVRAPKRREIRSFLDCMEKRSTGEVVQEGEDLESVMGALYRLDSGHIHGKASSIMRLYDGKAGKFCTDGAIDEEFIASELRTLWQTTYAVMQCIATLRGQAFGWKSRQDTLRMAKKFAAVAWQVH